MNAKKSKNRDSAKANASKHSENNVTANTLTPGLYPMKKVIQWTFSKLKRFIVIKYE